MNRIRFAAVTLILCALGTSTLIAQKSRRAKPANPPRIELLSLRDQMDLREGWLRIRLGTLLLPMMKRHGIDMWIVVNEEFNPDPVTSIIVPPIPMVGGRDIFVFTDRGERLERIALVGYNEERLNNHYSVVQPGRGKVAEYLKKLVDERDPKTIALDMGGSRGQMHGLSSDSYKFLASTLGDKNEKKFVSAEKFLTEFMDTRVPGELEHYRNAVRATDIITQRAFSGEVIKPGKTTVGDVRWWMLQQVNDLGLTVWFQPDLRIQRQTSQNTTSTGPFLDVAKESEVIERGDLIHVDFGLDYVGLSTDWQKMGYVLKAGERDAPAGLKAAFRNTNKLQDILFSFARPGMTGGEVYEKTIAETKRVGLDAMIYSHAIGFHGHGLGPSIDFRSNIGGGLNKILPGSYMSIELNTSSKVPDWGGQKVTMMAEDDAYMTDSGYQFFRPRQTEIYIIK